MKRSALEIRDRVTKGEESATAVLEDHLKRIKEHDEQVGAFLKVLEERAHKAAARIDEKRKKGEKLGKLAGVPVAIKDNINIAGEITTCGSQILHNYRAPFDATVIRRLEEEDAVLIGKTNLDEFAMGSSTTHSAFQSTSNPWNLDCIPGGSSGGSAAAVCARFAPLALGSETGGSVRQPAALCGIVGFKPTYGRLSRYGLVAFGSSLDQIGPFSTSVADCGLIMEVMAGHCPYDATSIPEQAPSILSGLKQDLKGVKIGVPTALLQDLDAELRANFEAAVQAMRDLGAQTVEITLDLIRFAIPIYYILAPAEASTNLARFDGIRYGLRSSRAKTLSEIYDFSKEEGFGAEVKRRILLGTFVLSSGFQDAYYKKAQRVRTLMIREHAEAFKKCDVIALPTSPLTAYPKERKLEPLEEYLADIYTASANLAGLPGISIPSGFSKEKKPIGLQLLGPQKADARVIQIAHAYQTRTDHIKEPQL
ncbi:MAG: Asp-tRNA(Asn)/Glu-tRNA(Gln) amidotransferase subunit GatA [Parachlamydiales bacterium]